MGVLTLRQCSIQDIDWPNISNPLFNGKLTFKYNSRRDPLTVTPVFIGTGSPQLLFVYDNRGRLIRYDGVYSNGIAFEFLHTYFYDGQGRITGDSLYHFGNSYEQRGTSDPFRHWRVISYDHFDRVSKEVITTVGVVTTGPPMPVTANYSYDGNGNLENGNTYDSGVNILLTNRIWRFIGRDYSINNGMPADAYNDHRLPILYSDVNSFDSYDVGIFSAELLSPLTIQYNCTDGNGLGDAGKENEQDYLVTQIA